MNVIQLYDEINGLLRSANVVLNEYYFEYIDTSDPSGNEETWLLHELHEKFVPIMETLNKLNNLRDQHIEHMRFIREELDRIRPRRKENENKS